MPAESKGKEREGRSRKGKDKGKREPRVLGGVNKNIKTRERQRGEILRIPQQT